MLRLACLLLWLVPCFVSAEEAVAPPAEPANAEVLFNGKDLTGWMVILGCGASRTA